MAKLCPRGKAAAKRKFKVYPSHMLICMLLQFVQVKLHLEAKRKNELKKLKAELLHDSNDGDLNGGNNPDNIGEFEEKDPKREKTLKKKLTTMGSI